ncbi:coiled-coil domain-containing protein 152-like [Oculina patagonica]
MAATGNAVRQAVDLDNLIQEYVHFEQVVRKTGQENSCLQKEIRSLNKQLQSSQDAEKIALEEAEKFKAMVDGLQKVLLQRCDKEEENAELKSQITLIKEKSIRLEQDHKNQISKAINNHKQEILRLREEALQQRKREITTLEKSQQEKSVQIQQLQKQLADATHAHHTEIVKLRLEYDEKLLKLQRERNNAKAQAGQSFNANTDIFRKKLQFVKAEAQKEINALKSKVADLERKLAVQQMPATKRKMF